METIIFEITDQKSYKLLQGMEELKLIKMKNHSSGISKLPKKIKSDIYSQLKIFVMNGREINYKFIKF